MLNRLILSFLTIIFLTGHRALPLVIDGDTALEKTADFVQLGPRASGTPGAQRAADYLLKACREMGYTSHLDAWQEKTSYGSITFRNVRALLEGSGPDFIIIASHYDTKKLPFISGFVGANDSGSSTGLLLTIMEQLASLPAWNGCTIEFLFFDGEECVSSYSVTDGLHGSRYYAEQIRSNNRTANCRAMILLDMIGDADLTLTLSQDTDTGLLARLNNIAQRQGVAERITIYPRGNILDDHRPFQNLGIPAINLIDFDYGPGNSFWHTSEDTIDKLSPQSLAIVGNLAIHLILDLARQEPEVGGQRPESSLPR